MTNLDTRFMHLDLPNPFFLSAGPCTASWEAAMEALQVGWGGVVLNTICSSTPPVQGLHEQVIRSGRTKWGVVGAEPVSDHPLDEWLAGIPKIRAAFPTRLLLASIFGDGKAESWQMLAERLGSAGACGFEINACLPNPLSREGVGGDLGQDPDALAQVVAWVREATALPIVVRLSPNVTDILPIAKSAMDAGAEAFIATGSLLAAGGIDPDELAPSPTFDRSRLLGRYRGPGLKPVALRWTAAIAKALPVPLIGSGGIVGWEDAVEFFAVGASAVSVGSGAAWNGIGLIDDLETGLLGYLREHGYRSPSEIRGRALPRIVGFDELDLDHKLIAVVDKELCNGCEVCVRACGDGGFQAITMSEGLAFIDASKCDGCGLCACVCPTNAIRMRDRQSGQQAPS